jgi:hypothetical protein
MQTLDTRFYVENLLRYIFYVFFTYSTVAAYSACLPPASKRLSRQTGNQLLKGSKRDSTWHTVRWTDTPSFGTSVHRAVYYVESRIL